MMEADNGVRRSAEQTRNTIIAAAFRLLYREGFARVSMDAIAHAAGITKRTLYNHFDSKDTLVGAVLEQQDAEALRHIQTWGDTKANSAEEFIATLFEQLQAWASQPDWLGSGFTRISFELADRPGHRARRAARAHKRAVECWLSEELRTRGATNADLLARQLLVMVEGTMSLILIHGDTGYASAAAVAAKKLARSQ